MLTVERVPHTSISNPMNPISKFSEPVESGLQDIIVVHSVY